MARNKRHSNLYVVFEGLQGGYLPNVVSYFSTKTGAMDYMVWRARDARDNGYKVCGAAQDGWYAIGEHEEITLDYAPIDSFVSDLAAVGIDASGWDLETLIQYLNDQSM